MGAVSIDVNANERKFETMFPMNTRDGVETFLSNYNHLEELMYMSGDYDALIMLVDFDTALEKSKLSLKEKLVLNLVFIQDMQRVDVAKIQNVKKQTIQKLVERATEKIAKYYDETGDYNVV